jgi:hypothetical protein
MTTTAGIEGGREKGEGEEEIGDAGTEDDEGCDAVGWGRNGCGMARGDVYRSLGSL